MMGYTTDFYGEFTLNRPLEPQHAAYLRQFNETRRVKRDPQKAALLPDPVREAAGLPIGPEGAYFVGGRGPMGQGEDDSVIDGNLPPGGVRWDSRESWEQHEANAAEAVANGAQPGLWCQWVPNEEGTAIVWDEGEKFYDYVEWLKYLIAHFLEPWGYVLNGQVEWSGEDRDDAGIIFCKDNAVEAVSGDAEVSIAQRPTWERIAYDEHLHGLLCALKDRAAEVGCAHVEKACDQFLSRIDVPASA